MYIIHFQLSHFMRLRLFCPSMSRQFPRQFSFPGKMSSGRGSLLTPESGNRPKTVGVDGPSPDVSTGTKVGYSHDRGQTLQRNIVSEHPKFWSASEAVNEEEWPPLSASIGSSSKAKRRSKIDLRTQVEERPANIGSSQLEASPVAHLRSEEENYLPTSFGKKRVPSPIKRHKLHQTYPEYSLGAGESDYAKVGVDGPSPDVSTGTKVGYSHDRGQTLQQNIVSEHPNTWSVSDAVNEEEWPSLSSSIFSSSKAKRRTKIELRTQVEERPANIGSSQLEASPVAHLRSEEENSLPTSFGKKRVASPIKRHKLHQTNPEYSLGAGETDYAKGLPEIEPFDICPSKCEHSMERTGPVLRPGMVPEIEPFDICLSKCEHSMERTGPVLRPGMVLLKSYITLDEQVQIVEKCRELGIGPGGFYQPGYGDGAKLRLQMMCLGLDWDPETRKYNNKRQVDGSEPPGIPCEFNALVKRAIQDSHALIGNNIWLSDVEDLFPDMSPNICIVNFYTTSGRLGLHQDRDESKESIRKGLPVISFSVGDTAEFLYGDKRDVEKAEKVQLESGDVLIFGGKSRNVFHGVKSIIPNSAPPALLRKVMLRPGRLNLTFRQY